MDINSSQGTGTEIRMSVPLSDKGSKERIKHLIVIMKGQQSMKNNSNRKANKPAETQTLLPLREQIEARAYEIWSASGGGPGRDLEHWLQAEAEILKATQERSGPGSRPQQ